MIIYNLNILRCPTLPAKTDPPLVIDSDAVLAFSLAFQSFQSVAWRRSQISKLLLRRGGIADSNARQGTLRIPFCPTRDEPETDAIRLHPPSPRRLRLKKWACHAGPPSAASLFALLTFSQRCRDLRCIESRLDFHGDVTRVSSFNGFSLGSL